MTKYYTHKSDFDAGNMSTWYSNLTDDNGQTITRLLDKIKTVTESVKANDAVSFYKPVGDAELGKSMPKSPYTTSYDKVMKMMASARRIHEEVVLRMDKKYTKGLDTSLSHTSDINSGKNAYKTSTFPMRRSIMGSYQVAQPNGGYKTETYLSKTTTEHYSLNDLLSDEKSPIKATQAVYDTRVANFREMMTEANGFSNKEIQAAKSMSNEELIDKYGLAPQAMVYDQLRGTQWQEEG